MGKLIVIDGLDGSGKGTQTRLLEKYLLEKGVNAKRIDFPRYGTTGCSLVEAYLGGKLGNDPAATGAYASSLFFCKITKCSCKPHSAAGADNNPPGD